MMFLKIRRKEKRFSSIKIIFYSILAYLFIMFIMIGVVKPNGFYHYFFSEKGMFDVDIYTNLAQYGYYLKKHFAMFPLWPLMIQGVAEVFSVTRYHLVANLTALLLFFVSLPLYWAVLKKVFDRSTALLLFLCYVFNPLSLFHGIGYSESLTSLEFSIWLFFIFRIIYKEDSAKENHFISKLFLNVNYHYAMVFIASFALGLSRPIFLQFFLAVFSTFFIMWLFNKKRVEPTIKRVEPTIAILGSAFFMFLGSLIFYLFSYWNDFGFFAAFKAQSEWNRFLGLHWDIIFRPKSIGGSDNVLNWDLQAFWFPLLFLMIAFYFSYVQKVPHFLIKYKERWQSHDAIFWIALFFSCAHSAVQFLTYDLFASTSRYIFGVPLIYYVLGRILGLLSEKVRIGILFSYFIYSLSFFIYWWTRYAREGWIG